VSDDLTTGAYIITVPHDPLIAPTRNEDTTESSVIIDLIEATLGSEDGGSDITSYVVYWDSGTSGATFTALVGESSDNLLLEVSASSSITSGVEYQLKYFLRNSIGDSAFSPVLTIKAATVPGAPNTPTVAYIAASTYRLAFFAPLNTGGSGVTISDYTLEFKAQDGTFSEYLTTCDGADATIMANLNCLVDLAVFTGSQYNLVEGDILVARLLATNEIGIGSYSSESTDSVYIVAVPSDPTVAPLRNALSSKTSMVIDLTTITSDGGVSLTSYILESNGGGSGDVYSEEVGDTTDSLLTQITLTVVAGTRFKYRYKVRNEIGDSGYSPVLDTYAAVEPDQPLTATTEIYPSDETLVKITWAEPADTGAIAILSYTIVIGDSVDTFTESSFCDGTDSSTILNLYCLVPLSELLTTFGLD